MNGFSAEELARMVGARLVGPADVTVEDVAGLEAAGPKDLAFLRDEREVAAARRCKAGVLAAASELDGFAGATLVCADVEMAMATLLAAIAERRFAPPEGVSRLASVSPSATLGEGVSVGEFAMVGDGAVIEDGAVIYPQVYVGPRCHVGPRTVLHAHVSIHEGVRIGADCIIHYNAVIGAAGFGFLQREGRNVKLCQLGTVRIGDRVEIGALSTVDRATLDATVIEDGVKMDDHCHVAHNCHVGPECILAGYAKLGGSVRLGRGVILAAEVGVADHLTIGDGAVLGARTGATGNVPAGAVVMGMPPRPVGEQRRIYALWGKLPEMMDRLRRLEKELEDLRRRPDAES